MLGTGENSAEDLVIQYQKFFELPETGMFDSGTIMKMKQARCGNADYYDFGEDKFSTKFKSVPTKNKFTYSLLNYPSTLKVEEVDSIMAHAFDLWSHAPFLCFSPSPYRAEADIKISFESGPKNKLDGRWDECSGDGTTVGHMHSPNRGQIYFDDHEKWATNSSDVSNLTITSLW